MVASPMAVYREECNLTLWQAWIQIKQGALEQARAILDTACADGPPKEARRALLRALLARASG